MISNLPEKLTSVRHGLTFASCLQSCVGNQELVSNFDRLKGTNLSLRGAPIDLAIDRAVGRLDAEIESFVEFCWDVVFLRFGDPKADISQPGDPRPS